MLMAIWGEGFKSGLLYVAPAVVELTPQTRLAANSQIHLPLPLEYCDERCALHCLMFMAIFKLPWQRLKWYQRLQ